MKFCQWASILTQRLALYLLSAWGQKGWGHLLTARGLGVIGPHGGVISHPWGGGVGRPRGGCRRWLPTGRIRSPPLSCQHWVWEGWWSGTITKMVKGIDSWEFPKEQSLVEDKPESGTQKYSKCQTPPYEKNKLLLNEYLGDFMHFETLFFFSVEMGLTSPVPPP